MDHINLRNAVPKTVFWPGVATIEIDVDSLIIVINGAEDRGEQLKELIEFMDVPRVQVANADNWREHIGERRLAAIFVGDDLEEAVVERVVREVGELDPNTPIVRVAADGKLFDRE